jgi:FAD/FMN-containing dehydrogenase
MSTPLIDQLRNLLGPTRCLTGEDVPARFRADRTEQPPTIPRALVTPASTDEVAAVMRLCHAHGQPVVPQGGMTGLAGGAHPADGEVALSLERMAGVEEVDVASGTLTALAGTTLQTVQQAAEAAGLMYGVDLGARGSCTIGGNVATNAGGNQVLRYGMTRRQVLGLEVVTADGRVIRSMNKMMKNNTGYDWPQMFIGSEGTLGVITRVVVQLQPRPQDVQTALVAVTDTTQGLALLRALERELPSGLLAFEALWREMHDVATRELGLATPFPDGHDLVVLIEAPMGGGGHEALEALLGGFHERGLLLDASVATSGPQRQRLWALRESVYEYNKRFRFIHGFDVSVPLNRMPEALGLLRAAAPEWPADVRVVIFGHMADSNLHLLAVREAAGGPAEAKACDAIVYRCTHAVGGSVSAEHGIGRMKRAYLPLSRSAEELALMGQMKRMLDPQGLLSPGRVI